jgi:hypothetical protein
MSLKQHYNAFKKCETCMAKTHYLSVSTYWILSVTWLISRYNSVSSFRNDLQRPHVHDLKTHMFQDMSYI